jgi:hypothetical protein
MIQIQIEGIDELRQNLDKFGKDQTRILNRIVLKVAQKFRSFIKSNFLSGQYLNVRTGDLKKSMIAYKVKGEKAAYYVSSKVVNTLNGIGESVNIAGLANIYDHAGGVDIAPKDKKVLRFIGNDGTTVFSARAHLESKPFMLDASNRFSFDAEFNTATNTIFSKEFQKRGWV